MRCLSRVVMSGVSVSYQRQFPSLSSSPFLFSSQIFSDSWFCLHFLEHKWFFVQYLLVALALALLSMFGLNLPCPLLEPFCMSSIHPCVLVSAIFAPPAFHSWNSQFFLISQSAAHQPTKSSRSPLRRFTPLPSVNPSHSQAANEKFGKLMQRFLQYPSEFFSCELYAKI